MTPYQILTLLIGTITAVILLVQAGLALKSLKADHERRKKQATFEFVQKIRPAWIEARHIIEEKSGDKPLSSKELLEIDGNFQLLKLVRTLLGQLEHLSVGMNSRVFDKDLLYRMSGTELVTIYRRLDAYIKKAQNINPKAYIEYEDLVKVFEDRKRTKPDVSGNIVNS